MALKIKRKLIASNAQGFRTKIEVLLLKKPINIRRGFFNKPESPIAETDDKFSYIVPLGNF